MARKVSGRSATKQKANEKVRGKSAKTRAKERMKLSQLMNNNSAGACPSCTWPLLGWWNYCPICGYKIDWDIASLLLKKKA